MPALENKRIAPKKSPRPRPLGGHKRRRRRRPHKAPKGVRMVGTPLRPPPPKQPPNPPAAPNRNGGHTVYGRDLGNAQLKRLLWRAGFGPKPGDVDRLAGKSIQDVVFSLTRPSGGATLSGPEPRNSDGAIAPYDSWGDDHLWWLDRMVRSDQQLVERMTLIWHDWFATSNEGVGSQQLMIGQNQLFRKMGLGSFQSLLNAVTANPAMLLWLNGVENHRGAPNENYAREMMELFTLGADRGAYTEDDVREQARALTGFTNDYSNRKVAHNFHFSPKLHD